MSQKRYAPQRRAKRRAAPLRLPAAILLIAMVLVGGRSLLSPGLGAEQPVPRATPAALTPPPPKKELPARTEPTPAPEPAPASTPEPAPAVYDYAAPVPASDAVEDGWFSDAAFLGDSLTDGLMLYSGIRGAANLAYKGLTVQSVRTDKVIRTSDGKMTALDALKRQPYGKVYLLLGINELGWYNDERFTKRYGELIDLVRAAQPDAQIYLQTLLPVTAKKSSSHAWLKNEKVDVYNGIIAALAEEKQVYLVDTHAAFADGEDALPAEGSTDGVHLTKAYYKLWLNYLSTHTVSPS